MTENVTRHEVENEQVRTVVADAHLGHRITSYYIPDLEVLRKLSLSDMATGYKEIVAVADQFWRITRGWKRVSGVRPMLLQFGANSAQGLFEDFTNTDNLQFIRTKKRSLRTCMKIFPWIYKRDRPFWYVEPQPESSGIQLKIVHIEPAECDAPNFVKNTLFIFEELGGDWNVMAEDD